MKFKKKQINVEEKIDISNYINTNKEIGLTDKQVKESREKFGLNILEETKNKSFISLFFRQLIELMPILLLVSGFLSLGLSIYNNIIDPNQPGLIITYVQAFVLISIVLINALFGSLQEHKSNNAISELAKMTTSHAKVLRNGKIIMINSSELVIGDIVLVEAGDKISADSVLYSAVNLKCIEGVLTGESSEITKNATAIALEGLPLGEQVNKLFSGTDVINGRGFAIVTGIGNQTEIGKIASLLNSKVARMTPLQVKLHKLGMILGIMGITITICTFFFSLFVIEKVIDVGMVAFQPSLLLGVSLAAAAIPEGLNAIVNIILAIGVKRMSEKNGLIKKFPAVETFGSTAVICSDKTGTLTMNKMTIVKLWTNESNTEDVEGNDFTDEQNFLLKMASLCTDCTVSEDKVENPKDSIGDPTEIAIIDLALKLGFSKEKWSSENERIGNIPFDSDRKLMTVINKIDNKQLVIVKGAPDVLFARCKNFDKNTAILINDNWSNNAIRVLAIAVKNYDGKKIDDLDPNKIEQDLTFLGLIGMIDPPRPEVKQSIEECISAGIKPVMITGDHLNTAVSIAKNLGIIRDNNDLAITGTQLDLISDKYLNSNIENYSVFARVSPENKIRIVKAWQSRDQVVAMTGDGVNDAPALQAADIGCAMGITGTDVSKGAADMILTDDNFSTIVESVKSGRSIYDNIRRIVKFLLSSNIAGIISIVVGMFVFYMAFELMGWGKIMASDFAPGLAPTQEGLDYLNSNIRFQTTLTTIQILLNHIVIESLPGVALGTQRTTSSLMNKRPRSKYESLLADRLLFQILFSGMVSGVMTIIGYGLGSYVAILINAPGLRFYYGSIAAFMTITIGGVLKSISMSSSISIFKTKIAENKWVYLASFVSFIIIILAIMVPQLSSIFAERPNFLLDTTLVSQTQLSSIYGGKSANDLAHWSIYLIGLSGGIIPFFILEFEKMIEKKFFKHKEDEKITSFKLIQRPVYKHSRKRIEHSEINIIEDDSIIKIYESDLIINNYLSNDKNSHHLS